MSENLLVTYCAPTLAGIKTASLFSCECGGYNHAKRIVRQWNAKLNPKGVYAVIMRCRRDGEGYRALIYVYRRTKLEKDLSRSEIRSFLSSCGYECEDISDMLRVLSGKLSQTDDFPHEIGLFLGYPFHDVKGFINNKGRNCKCTGHWKVYSDEENAKKLFTKYDKCKSIYCRKHEEGTSICKLTVYLS